MSTGYFLQGYEKNIEISFAYIVNKDEREVRNGE